MKSGDGESPGRVYDADEGWIDPAVVDEDAQATEAYEPDDPKHPSFRERLAALWDSRPGK